MLSESRPLVLASASPRRREILANLRIPTLTHTRGIEVDEAIVPGEPPAKYLERIVRAKLDAAACTIFELRPNSMGDTLRGANVASAGGALLVADTSVIDGRNILGKPSSRVEAEAMIAMLAGKTHEVWTRFAIAAPEPAARVLHEETVVTRVTFRSLTPERIRSYVASGEGDDKAGAYGVQGLGAALVTRIDGSYSNVVGLPACELVLALESLGLR
jgi:septum formation protein